MNTAYPLGQGYNPGHQAIERIFPGVSSIGGGVSDQGTVDITLFGCVPGDEPCRSEVVTFRGGEGEGPLGWECCWGIGRKYFQLKG